MIERLGKERWSVGMMEYSYITPTLRYSNITGF